VSLRGKFVLYLALVHLVFAAVAAYLLGGRRIWLPVVEGVALLSFAVGLRLVHVLFAPLRLVRSGADLLQESDFATRFREVGQAELDPLIRVYNLMAHRLREERIRSEEQEHFLQKIVAASPSGVLTLDLDGRITMANPAAANLLGSTAEVLQGRRLAELGSPFAAALAGLQPGRTELLRLQGRRRVSGRVLTFMDRGFARRFLLLDELTEELHRNEKAAYEKLIRMMSHEVNNTTGAVRSLLESCLDYAEQLAPADRRDFAHALGVAIGRTGRMNQFMQDFADVVRLPAPRKQACDLRELLERIEILLQEESARRRIRWVWEGDEGLPPQHVDPVQMEQALLNICKNALEAMGENGTLGVHLDRDHGRACVRITDTGGGLPEAVREQLFTPFFTTKENGQGIGLTMVQEILLAHGCDFALENGPAGTAVFSVLFPQGG